MNRLQYIQGYPVEIRPLCADEGGGWLATFPDLAGCMSDGDTADEALANAADALNDWIEASRVWNKPIPAPYTPAFPAKPAAIKPALSQSA